MSQLNRTTLTVISLLLALVFLYALIAEAQPAGKYYCSVSVAVKSNRNGMPIDGAQVRIQCYKKRKKWDSYWREKVIEITTDGGGQASSKDYGLTGSAVGGRATANVTWDYKYDIMVSASDFRPSQQTIKITENNRNPVAYFYLSPR